MMTKILLTSLLSVTFATVCMGGQPVRWKHVYELFENRSALNVGGLSVQMFQLEEWNWELRVSLNGRELHNVRDLAIPEGANFGLFPLLDGSTPQLIVHANTGGSSPYAVCWIYTTDPEPRLVYSSEPYWQGGPCGDLEVGDLDGDGVFEIRHIVATFRGYDGRCNACGCSPCPEAVFRYDQGTKRYCPANWEFPQNLKARIDEHLRYLRGIDRTQDTIGHYYAGGWLNVVFEYLYAGQDEDAWRFLETELGPRLFEKERQDILETVRKERFYREMREARRKAQKRRTGGSASPLKKLQVGRVFQRH